MKKAIILSSGGVDSTTCVSLAVDRLGAENVVTASIFYGQKHKKEILQSTRKKELMLLLFPLIKKILFRFKKPWKQVANQRHHMFVMQ